jgi:hypothetical protein
MLRSNTDLAAKWEADGLFATDLPNYIKAVIIVREFT